MQHLRGGNVEKKKRIVMLPERKVCLLCALQLDDFVILGG
jgi:hypothetical protein